MRRFAGVSGSLFAAVAVVCGAFAAHPLRTSLGPESLAVWRTAVEYQFLHAFALLFLARPQREMIRAERIACVAYVLGILLFCGSLYALALGAHPRIGIVTPVGGLSFIIGWLAMAVGLWRNVD